MKNKILAGFLFMAPFLGFAQQNTDKLPFVAGPKAGINVSRLVTEEKNDAILNFKSRDRIGFHAGFFARFPFKRWYFQPEIICYMKGGRGLYDLAGLDTTNPSRVMSFKQKVNIMSVDMPLLIGYNLGKTFLNFRVYAGPDIGYSMTKNVKYETESPAIPAEFNMNVKDATWSLTGGIGLDVWKFSIDARYERGLHNISWNSNFSQVPSSFMFTMGFKTF